MLIVKFILILTAVCIVAILINGIESYYNSRKILISFKESIDALGVPVIAFINNGYKLHLLVDTGSDASYIRKEVLDFLDVKSSNMIGAPIMTAGGEISSNGVVTLDIHYDKLSFNNDFEISEVPYLWDEATKDLNIKIDGILGSLFLKKYGYQIDFHKSVVYLHK